MQDRLAIIAFIRKTMKPERYIEPMRSNLSVALVFASRAVNAAGVVGVRREG